ncbi:hypothetical protein ZWY2020_041083 [Hordeum vulgare]|nr:hypothetical protein ZWY2020_041083 [Hordeum vulgare]
MFVPSHRAGCVAETACSSRATPTAPSILPSASRCNGACREKLNSMDLLQYMAPVAVVLLVPATLMMEPDALGAAAALAWEDPSFVWMLIGNSSLVYSEPDQLPRHQAHQPAHPPVFTPTMVLCLLIDTTLQMNTHKLMLTHLVLGRSLQVLRNAKGAVAVVVSIIFKNSVTVMGMLGYGVTIAGVVLYGEAKKRSK